MPECFLALNNLFSLLPITIFPLNDGGTNFWKLPTVTTKGKITQMGICYVIVCTKQTIGDVLKFIFCLYIFGNQLVKPVIVLARKSYHSIVKAQLLK